MKKNILFIIFAVFALIFIIAFGMSTYRYYQAIHSDDPIDPYVLVEQGKTTVVRGDIAIDMTITETYSLSEGDVLITYDDSIALIDWPDRSTTRLGANSRLIIDRMRVADDYSRIELVARLESGKIWTNIIRTLYPDSRVEFRLPKSGTVAGVRGTVFEINLDANYIHSVDHSVMLSNAFGKFVTLLPGESVMANDIMKKITKGLDTTWSTLNSLKDASYIQLRNTQLRANYSLLTGKSMAFDIWDRFVRWILSWFSAFRDIDIISAMSKGDTSYLKNLPQDAIMKWYQSFQSTDFVQERDIFRGAIMSLANGFTNGDKIIENMTRGALWDMQTASGFTLQNAQSLLNTYADKSGISIDVLLSNIRKIDANTLTTESRAIYEKLFK